MFHSNRPPMNDGLKKLIQTTFITVIALIMIAGIGHRVAEQRALYEYRDAALWQAVSGDTLWDIAEEISTPKHDPRRVIDDIRELNPEMGMLRANDIIRVPVYMCNSGRWEVEVPQMLSERQVEVLIGD